MGAAEEEEEEEDEFVLQNDWLAIILYTSFAGWIMEWMGSSGASVGPKLDCYVLLYLPWNDRNIILEVGAFVQRTHKIL